MIAALVLVLASRPVAEPPSPVLVAVVRELRGPVDLFVSQDGKTVPLKRSEKRLLFQDDELRRAAAGPGEVVIQRLFARPNKPALYTRYETIRFDKIKTYTLASPGLAEHPLAKKLALLMVRGGAEKGGPVPGIVTPFDEATVIPADFRLRWDPKVTDRAGEIRIEVNAARVATFPMQDFGAGDAAKVVLAGGNTLEAELRKLLGGLNDGDRVRIAFHTDDYRGKRLAFAEVRVLPMAGKRLLAFRDDMTRWDTAGGDLPVALKLVGKASVAYASGMVEKAIEFLELAHRADPQSRQIGDLLSQRREMAGLKP
ncbi:MAG: hypothetical protein ACO1SV_02575 [Fimbriimonas sp.]